MPVLVEGRQPCCGMIVVAAHGVVSGVFSGRVIPQCQDGYTDRAVSSNRDRGYHVASPVWLHIILEVALATAAATVEAVSTEAAAAAAAANSSRQQAASAGRSKQARASTQQHIWVLVQVQVQGLQYPALRDTLRTKHLT